MQYIYTVIYLTINSGACIRLSRVSLFFPSRYKMYYTFRKIFFSTSFLPVYSSFFSSSSSFFLSFFLPFFSSPSSINKRMIEKWIAKIPIHLSMTSIYKRSSMFCHKNRLRQCCIYAKIVNDRYMHVYEWVLRILDVIYLSIYI